MLGEMETNKYLVILEAGIIKIAEMKEKKGKPEEKSSRNQSTYKKSHLKG